MAVRVYLLCPEQEGRNPGGIHTCFRALRAFLNWWESEVEPEDWRNPMKKVKTLRGDIDPLEPVDIDTVRAMLKVCPRRTFTGDRDRAMMLSLLDTSVRASELLAMNLDDLDVTGANLVRCGKGGKPSVYIGKKSQQAVRAYLRHRDDDNAALWVTVEGKCIKYQGLRAAFSPRLKKTGVKEPTLHSFRRYFALTMLRKGEDAL